jgi:hypothetical protein
MSAGRRRAANVVIGAVSRAYGSQTKALLRPFETIWVTGIDGASELRHVVGVKMVVRQDNDWLRVFDCCRSQRWS